jgi:thioesterase domain-containing protein
MHDNFFEMGGHSLLAVRLMAKIKQRFKISLPLTILFHSPTVEKMALALQKNAAQRSAPVVAIRSEGANTPLYCIPGVGGDTLGFRDLAVALGADQPVFGLQPMGLDGTLAPHNSVEALARAFIEAMHALGHRGPYALLGHSFGGWVAFEMAAQLQAQGEKVSMLVMLDSIAPQGDSFVHAAKADKPGTGGPANGVAEGLTHAALRETLLIHMPHLLELPDDELDAVLVVAQQQLRVEYRPQALNADFPVLLFKAGEAIQDPAYLALHGKAKDDVLGWSRLFTRTPTVIRSRGNHYTLLQKANVESIARQLQTFASANSTPALKNKLEA